MPPCAIVNFANAESHACSSFREIPCPSVANASAAALIFFGVSASVFSVKFRVNPWQMAFLVLFVHPWQMLLAAASVFFGVSASVFSVKFRVNPWQMLCLFFLCELSVFAVKMPLRPATISNHPLPVRQAH